MEIYGRKVKLKHSCYIAVLTLCLWLSGIQNIMTMDMGRFKILMKHMVCLYFCGGAECSSKYLREGWMTG